jgi:hypothetical protein
MKRRKHCRLLIVAQLIGAWAIALPIGALMLAPPNVRDDPARLLESIALGARFFGFVSLPLLGVALAVCLAFARSVASYPFCWTFAAVVTTGLFGFGVINNVAGAVYAFAVSIPAAVLFLLFNDAWPMDIRVAAIDGSMRP